MTEYDQESSAISDFPRGDDLPPVQPPSAGFIVQLFVFPALIVMGVVAIWWMFGLIAAGEQDWHKLLQELQSTNLHIRNRAMYGLAQVLDRDVKRGDQGEHLRENREIATAFSDQLIAEMRRNSNSKDSIAIQEYLTRALGMLEPFDITAPALRMALDTQRDEEIRKSAVVSLSVIAGRAIERGQPLNSPEIVDALIELSGDPLPVLRQSAAFALGLFDSPDATHQLEVLLGNGDQLTQVNAAIALARHGSTLGFPVMLHALKLPVSFPEKPAAPPNAANPTSQPDSRSTSSDDQFLVVKNVLKAVHELARKFDADQRNELIPRVEALSKQHPEIKIQVDAISTLNALKAAAAEGA